MPMADFPVRLYDQTAVNAFLKRYADSRREIDTARKRLERLEYLAQKDARYLSGPVREAIEKDKRRLMDRIITSEGVKAEVMAVIESMPHGDERRVIELSYVARLNIAQIADTMNYSQRNICNIKDRAVKWLIDNYGGECKNGSDNEKETYHGGENYSAGCKNGECGGSGESPG